MRRLSGCTGVPSLAACEATDPDGGGYVVNNFQTGEWLALTPETTGVWRAVHRLPRRQRQAVALHYVGQLSMAEIADVMGCSEGAVKSHLHRARDHLRGSLATWNEREL